MTHTIEMLLNHRSIRKYSDKAVSEDIVKTIIASAQMAPTSSNFQAYTMIEVVDTEKRKMLSQLAGNQTWIVEAPLVLMFCGDLNRGKKYYEGTDASVFSNTEQFTIATIDAALAAQKGFIAAQSLGLGGVFVGGIRNDLETISKAFQLPDLVYPLFLLCLGYPDDNPEVKPRLPMDVVRKIDVYDDSEDDELIQQYDKTMVQYYVDRTDGAEDHSWTKHCGRLLKGKSRDHVGTFFRKIGLLKK